MISLKTRRRELEFANNLAKMAASSPDPQTKREIYSVVRSIRQRHGFSWEQKIAEVWRVIKLGATTANDLRNETCFNAADISAIIKDLRSRKKIDIRNIRNNDSAGRPMQMIVRLVNEL